MWDDLQDWKEDLQQGTPSLLLARLVSERPARLEGEAGRDVIKQLARELYYGGHARHVLELTLTAAGKDLHSGRHGGGVANPLHAMARLIA